MEYDHCFPAVFSGAFPIAATGTVTAADVKTCADVPVWMISSTKDPAVNYNLVTTPLWKNVCKYNNSPESCRLTSITEVVEPVGSAASDNHHMAKVITYDFHMLDGSTYPNATTVDGKGNTVSLENPNGIITWMNTLSSDYDGEPGNGSGNIELNAFTRFFNQVRNIVFKLVNIVQRLLGL